MQIPLQPVFQFLLDTAGKYPDRVAVRYYDQSMTYQQLLDRVDRLATALAATGLQKGDRAAVMFPNRPEYIISYYAVLRAGGIVVQVNPFYTEHELLHIMEDSGASWILAAADQADKLQSVTAQHPVKEVLLFDDSNGKGFGVDTERVFADTSPNPPQLQIDPQEDVAVLQYTGGTTGRSKGVMLTHYNLVANARQSYQFSSSVIEIPGEVLLGLAPLYHVYGMTAVMNLGVLIGGTIVLRPKFDAGEVLEIIKTYRPTLFSGVPTMYIAMLNHPKSAEVDMTSFKSTICGSAPLPVEIIRQFEARTGAKITEGYGLSEAGPVTHRNPMNGVRKPGSIGIPFPLTEARVVDLETGTKIMPPGEPGELVVKGPQVMKGYWNNPEETAKTIRDGWLHTGDIATIDDDGYFYIVGRKKEMIITGGFNVYPKEVEEVLYQHSKVQEAAVVGIPDPYRGEAVKSFVVPKQGETVTEEELISFCRERLTAYKVPRSIEFRDALPKTTVGKILKRTLVEQELERMKSANR
ncbi:long-chain-fatty-acid--CoA ligase [Effusibacillus dendaii]|uniref:Long-chain-fatty-acid--CoA ligase n=1 Tax=Effusibacillus dendaii TaxID=2743772 RepID=A0A7I8D9Q8_9BACL|nr:long-chain fatty acid--CoA ligase [Effusibacillus dendaii]BCJ86844.1 long-chain-fatty-acid--CoA ligase [Effusibacillus dendaii]